MSININRDMDRTSIFFSMLVIMSIIIGMHLLGNIGKPEHLSWQCQQNNIGCPEGYINTVHEDPQAP